MLPQSTNISGVNRTSAVTKHRLGVWVIASVLALGYAQTSPAGVSSGLLGAWAFDGNGLDSSGNGRDLTLNGGAGFAAGKFGEALDLHHLQSQFAARSVNDAALNFGSNDFTIQIWVNFNTVAFEQTLIEKFSGASGPGWTVTTAFGGTKYQFYTSGGAIELDSSVAPTANAWHDILVERSGSSFGLYLDGSLVASQTSSLALDSTSNPLLIGRRNSGDSRDFSVDGRIDDAAIWDRALSSSEIATLWNGGAGTPLATTVVPELSSMCIWSTAAVVLLGILRNHHVRRAASIARGEHPWT